MLTVLNNFTLYLGTFFYHRSCQKDRHSFNRVLLKPFSTTLQGHRERRGRKISNSCRLERAGTVFDSWMIPCSMLFTWSKINTRRGCVDLAPAIGAQHQRFLGTLFPPSARYGGCISKRIVEKVPGKDDCIRRSLLDARQIRYGFRVVGGKCREGATTRSDFLEESFATCVDMIFVLEKPYQISWCCQ